MCIIRNKVSPRDRLYLWHSFSYFIAESIRLGRPVFSPFDTEISTGSAPHLTGIEIYYILVGENIRSCILGLHLLIAVAYIYGSIRRMFSCIVDDIYFIHTSADQSEGITSMMDEIGRLIYKKNLQFKVDTRCSLKCVSKLRDRIANQIRLVVSL